MDRPNVGKVRRLHQLANAKGMLTVCAIDHRESLRRMLNSKHPEAVSYQEMVDFKLDLCRAVAPFASAILLDPEYGAGQAIVSGALPGTTGLLVSIEASGYEGSRTRRLTQLIPEWSVAKAKKLGASAIKLLIYYRPDLKDIAAKQLELIRKLAAECITEDMPLLVEAVSYPITDNEAYPGEFASMKSEIVIETARQISPLPIDVLKAEFPGYLSHEKDEGKLLGFCQQLNEASRVPWVLLSGGHSFELFRKEIEIACKAGASGFLAGRALWQEATQIDSPSSRREFFHTIAASRLKELSELANTYGRPWFAKFGAPNGNFALLVEGWYKDY